MKKRKAKYSEMKMHGEIKRKNKEEGVEEAEEEEKN